MAHISETTKKLRFELAVKLELITAQLSEAHGKKSTDYLRASILGLKEGFGKQESKWKDIVSYELQSIYNELFRIFQIGEEKNIEVIVQMNELNELLGNRIILKTSGLQETK